MKTPQNFAIADSTFLITGGTGSFGKTMTEYLLNCGAGLVRVLSRDESKQFALRNKFEDPRLELLLGDVREINTIEYGLRDIDYVFHAAALKQVPSCEFYPMEAVQTNILGAENVMRAAMQNGVKKCVVLSTDKAVYPINAMGISKAMMEKVMAAKARLADTHHTVLCATRYGNVMASRGSVIPLFLSQIQKNFPLTITDPSMTRFLMSLDDSVNLVLYAFEHAKPGDIFVQKSPASTIGDLAVAMKELMNSSVEIKNIGTRHGEKLYETLVSREEMVRADDLGDYYRIPADARDLNYDKYFVEGEQSLTVADDYTSHNTKRLSIAEVKATLMKLDLMKEAVGD